VEREKQRRENWNWVTIAMRRPTLGGKGFGKKKVSGRERVRKSDGQGKGISRGQSPPVKATSQRVNWCNRLGCTPTGYLSETSLRTREKDRAGFREKRIQQKKRKPGKRVFEPTSRRGKGNPFEKRGALKRTHRPVKNRDMLFTTNTQMEGEQRGGGTQEACRGAPERETFTLRGKKSTI